MLNLRFQDYHPTRGRTAPAPSAANVARLAVPKGYHAANACGCHRARYRQRPSSARAHDSVGLGTEASRTAPATRYAPRQPGGRGAEEARCFRDGAAESATTRRGPVPPPARPPALPRSRPPRNGSSAQGACERGGRGKREGGREGEPRTEQSRGYLLVLVEDVGGEAPCR